MEVLIVQTGDKCYPKNIGGYAFEFGNSYAMEICTRYTLPNYLKFHLIKPFLKDSLEISVENRFELADLLCNTQFEKILVTHGTDTMIATGQYLTTYEDQLKNKLIVITGAFRPGAFKNTDADFNVPFAIGGLIMSKEPGIFIAMHGKFYRPNEVVRDEDTGNFIPIKIDI
ncbi:hypothetical protein EWB00_006788 [Schistosoma japonicum]|uniref:L-asparaginase N-terminal domain-containing protein n=1 Tax=Schistosoma japonicum TaxID=6182 RepID=A0A4Z2CXD2_SCHJA|nr:hypothetical protein KSF78_0007445 [Schistosoma japonicum]TNN08804.1 hypothetical protein EWB00_006788 [Schistosoma japonicum]